VVLPGWTIDVISVVPRGAWPSYAHGYYDRDNAFYRAWDTIAADRDGFVTWMERNVLSAA
jgi:glutaconate CoA-transferase subunit A